MSESGRKSSFVKLLTPKFLLRRLSFKEVESDRENKRSSFSSTSFFMLLTPKFVIRRRSYNKIMEINEQINEITKVHQLGYDIQAVANLERQKDIYIKEYNNAL